MTSEFSWQNSVSLCFILYSKAKFACYFRYVLTSYFCIPVSSDEKDIFFWVLVLEGLVGHHRPFNFSFFSIPGWGIDLDYCDSEWSALERNRGHSVICTQVQRSNCQHPLDHGKSKRVPEKHLCFIDYAKAFDCVDHNKLENSERDGNTRPPDLPLEKFVCRSGSNS